MHPQSAFIASVYKVLSLKPNSEEAQMVHSLYVCYEEVHAIELKFSMHLTSALAVSKLCSVSSI